MDDNPLMLPQELTDVPVTQFATRVKPISMSDAQRSAVSGIEDELRDRDEPSMVERVEALDKSDAAAPPEVRSVRHQALLAWWTLQMGLEAGARRNLPEAKRCARLAAYGFALLDVPEQLHDAALLALDAEASHLELTGHSEAAQPLRARNINSLLVESGGGRMGPMQRELLLSQRAEPATARSSARIPRRQLVQG